MENEKATEKRTRNYATIVYPESAPEDWQSILSSHHVPALISPLHDNDVCANGEPKKAHYHVMIMFENVKTKSQAIEIFDTINGVGVEIVKNLRGYARYLCHLDDPNKAQYSIDDVVSLCGADYIALYNLPSDKYQLIRDMMQYCIDNNVVIFADLLAYAAVNKQDWFRVLCDNGTYVISQFLKSLSYKQQKNN